MHDIVLIGGDVLTDDGIVVADVAMDEGKITAIGSDVGAGRSEITAKRCWIGPGFVDVHTHLREPGQEWKEDIASGTAAAAAGGYTALVAMPNTEPAIDSGDAAKYVVRKAQQSSHVHVASAGCLTIGRKGEQMAPLDELWDAGVRIFTDDGDSVDDSDLLRSIMKRVSELGGVVSQHAVDGPLSSGGHMHEGSVSERLGIEGIPREADDTTIARDIALARDTGVRYHVQHLSTAGGVALIKAAREEGLAVTAEATPHHLMFDHEDVASLDTSFKMMPPLRDPDDRMALIEALRSGVVRVVGTDHAPHGTAEKHVPFEQAMNGVIGLEWAGAVVNTVVGMAQTDFFDRMSMTPARIAGFEEHGRPLKVGRDANIVVFDPEMPWTPTDSRSKSRNAPYLGRDLTGRVVATLFRGTVTHRSEG